MPRSSTDIERNLESILRNYLFSSGIAEPVTRGWYPFRGLYAPFYTPIPDIAVGPYAVERRLIPQYDDLEIRVAVLIRELKTCFQENCARFRENNPGIVVYPFSDFVGNENARCFMAIEIENKFTSKKDKLGSIINATALGRIGIVIGLDENTVEALISILGYLKFLASVDKPTFKTDNTFIISMAQIQSILGVDAQGVR